MAQNYYTYDMICMYELIFFNRVLTNDLKNIAVFLNFKKCYRKKSNIPSFE